MTDPIWYYAQGDAEKGPVTLSKIKSLIDNGRLSGDDLIWTEGMEDWQPAARVPGLLYDQPPAPPDETRDAIPSPKLRGMETRNESSATQVARQATASDGFWPALNSSRLILAVGLLLVLVVQGCDLVARRQVDRLQGMSQVARAQFQDEWDRKRIGLEDQRSELQESSNGSATDQARDQQIVKELSQLGERMKTEETNRTRHEWRYDSLAARDAQANYMTGAYWRSLLFVFSSIVFVVGLLSVGRAAIGPECWLAWTMLAIVVYSLFVGGGVWNPMILSS